MPYLDKTKAKIYYKEYHLRTWGKRKVKHRKDKQLRREKLSSWLKEYKSHLFCINCNENHPACLDFHHLNPSQKEGTIGNMISEGYAIKSIQKEIAKCIVLCKNCHSKTHYEIRNIT